MKKEQYIQEQLKKYRQADTEIQHHMLIIHLLGEIWELKEKANQWSNVFNDQELNNSKLAIGWWGRDISFTGCAIREDSDHIAGPPKSPFNFHLDKMQGAVEGDTVGFPPALSREERREWIRKNKNDAHKIFNELIKNDED